MHNKYLTFVLPVLGGLAIVGAGFSAWEFQESISKSDTLSGDISVTDIAESDRLTVTLSAEKICLELDQDGFENLNNQDVGIGVYSAYTDESTNTPWASTTSYTYKSGSITVPYITFDVTFEGYTGIETSDYTASYSFDFLTAGATDGTTTIDDYIDLESAVTSQELPLTVSGNNLVAEDVVLPLHFIYTQKPTNTTEYNTMVSAIDGKSFTLSLTVELTAVTE